MRIAIDFDETVFDRRLAQVIPGAVFRINEWSKQGHEITIFTNRPDYEYSTVQAILDAALIDYDRLICGKPSYDVFIDDKARQFKGWDQEYP
jgi:hypothetical protein